MKKILYLISIFALTMVSCSKDNVAPENDIDVEKGYPVTINANLADDSKTVLPNTASGIFTWGADALGVTVGTNNNVAFTNAGVGSGVFTGSLTGDVSGQECYIQYPRKQGSTFSLPGTQSTAKTEDYFISKTTLTESAPTQIDFNVNSATDRPFAYLKFAVTNTDITDAAILNENVKSITFVSTTASDVLTGNFTCPIAQPVVPTFTAYKSNSVKLVMATPFTIASMGTDVKYFNATVNPEVTGAYQVLVETDNYNVIYNGSAMPAAFGAGKMTTINLKLKTTKFVQLSSISDVKTAAESLADGIPSSDEYTLNPVTVVFQKYDKTYTFVKDATGYAVIFQADMTGQPKYYPGDVIKGFKVKAENFRNWFELIPQDDYPVKSSTTTAPTPESVTSLAALDYNYGVSSDQSRYVKMENAEITKIDDDYYADGILLYETPTKTAVNLSTLNDGDKVTIEGFPFIYNTTKQFAPTAFTVTAAADAVSADPTTLSWAGDETDAKTVTVTSSGAWTATIDNTADFTLSATSGVNGGTFTVTPTGTNDGSSAKTATVTLTLGTATATVACAQAVAGAATEYVFGQHADFATWGSSYTNHSLTYTDITANFTEYNRQTGTITDCPVTKGKEMVVILNDNSKSIGSVSFVLKQWTTKVQTVELLYSTDGTNYTTTGVTSSTFSIPTTTLPANTIAVKLKFNKTNQVGVYSCSMTIN